MARFVREVTIKVERAMKGNVTDGQSLVVRHRSVAQLPASSRANPSCGTTPPQPLGAGAPLGVFSGDFAST